MHIAISWDIKVAAPRRREIDDALKECLKGYSWIRPLTTFYVVKIDGDADRVIIRDRIVELHTANPGAFHLLITPTMSGGRYAGLLPRDTWDKVNKRTEP